jgi:predicted PurR-regulated permease PerM
MLVFGGRLFAVALEWIEPSKRERYRVLSRRIQRAVGGYVNGTLLIALIGGVVTAVTLAILGVPYFLPLGLVMALLGVVPFIGSTLGAVLVVGTTFLTSGVKAGVISLVVFLVYQQVESELLHPIVQRKTIQMNALLIALVMVVGTALAGVLGALLALPIAAAIQVVLQDVLERRKARWASAHEQSADGQLALPPADDDGERASAR